MNFSFSYNFMCFILLCVCAQSLSCVRFFVIPWTAAHQAPLSMGFSKNPGMGCHFLLQRIFPAQGLNPCLMRLLYWQVDSLSLNHQGSTHTTHTEAALLYVSFQSFDIMLWAFQSPLSFLFFFYCLSFTILRLPNSSYGFNLPSLSLFCTQNTSWHAYIE